MVDDIDGIADITGTIAVGITDISGSGARTTLEHIICRVKRVSDVRVAADASLVQSSSSLLSLLSLKPGVAIKLYPGGIEQFRTRQ